VDTANDGSSHLPSGPVPPSNRPLSRAFAKQRALEAPVRPMKLLKIASPKPSRPAGQDALSGEQSAQAEAAPGTHYTANIRADNPWVQYQKVYEIKLYRFVTDAIRKDMFYDPAIVRSFREDVGPTPKMKKLHDIRHENILTLTGSFSFKDNRYLIFEPVASPHCLTVYELGAILRRMILNLSGWCRPLLFSAACTGKLGLPRRGM
jgi:hypothetical protein